MRDFRELEVWRKAHALALKVYVLTKRFPAEERFGLTAQMRRSGVSVPCNIAEGCGRRTSAELGRFLQIAAGSAFEVEYQLLLSRDLGYLDDAAYEEAAAAVVEIKKMLARFLVTLRHRILSENASRKVRH